MWHIPFKTFVFLSVPSPVLGDWKRGPFTSCPQGLQLGVRGAQAQSTEQWGHGPGEVILPLWAAGGPKRGAQLELEPPGAGVH